MTTKLAKAFSDAQKGKATTSDIGRSLSQVANRTILGGFSDTLSDGAWTLTKWLTTDTDASVLDLATAIIMDKKIRTKQEEKAHQTFLKAQKKKENK